MPQPASTQIAPADLGHPCMVYTPPGYGESQQVYPALYLLHGIGDDASSWAAHGAVQATLNRLIEDGLMSPAIVVMPLTFLSEADRKSRTVPSAAAFEKLLAETILPAAEEKYRIVASAQHRVLAGLSMGGLLALETGLHRPDLFGFIGAFSAALQFRPVEDHVDSLKGSAALSPAPTVYIACGAQDEPLYTLNQAFAQQLTAKQVPTIPRFLPGEHRWPFWRERLRNLLPICFPVT